VHCRTALFAPGDSSRKLHKAFGLPTDAVVLDLEDSVIPEARATARDCIAEVLADDVSTSGDRLRVVRVNHPAAGWDPDDVALVRALLSRDQVDAVMIPKAESAADLDSFVDAVGRRVPLWPVATETPLAVTRLEEMAAHPDSSVMCWGPEDLSVLLGSFSTREDDGRLRPVFESIRWRALVAARAAGIEILDTVFVDVTDTDRLRAESREAAAAGFTGKMAIHPDQLPVIADAFAPSAELLDRSRRLLELRAGSPTGAFAFEGQMVDEPHFKLARRLLEAHSDGSTSA
jgi:citrate lyase subunit beta / citryl-CoA lyase